MRNHERARQAVVLFVMGFLCLSAILGLSAGYVFGS